MKLLITLADFADFTAFSTNIGASLVTPYIREAHTFDVKLPTAVRADLETELAGIDPAFKPEDFDTADFAVQAATAGWANTTLARLWYEAIRPLLVLESARRMLLWHGLHITPNAAEVTTDRPISSQQRAELRADLISKASYYRPLFEAGLRSISPTSTVPTCGTPRQRPSSGGLQISAV
jgi:hypothetical protein